MRGHVLEHFDKRNKIMPKAKARELRGLRGLMYLNILIKEYTKMKSRN